MPWLIAVFAAVMLLILFAGCRPAAKPPAPPTPGPGPTQPAPPEPDKPAVSLKTRDEIRARLSQLEKSEPPTELKPQAMCYAPTVPLERADYVCPKCGEKTIFAAKADHTLDNVVGDVSGLPEMRRLIGRMPVPWMQLDESQFCGKCSPGIDVPKLFLVVRVPGQAEPRKTADVGPEDLLLLQEFLSGADKYTDAGGGEAPMKIYLPRIEELLGVKP